jgi:hypothetical protein
MQPVSGAGRRFGADDVAIGLTLVVALLIAFNASEWLRGGFGWRWNYELVPLARLLPLILASIVYVVGALWLTWRTKRTAPVLAWAVMGGVALALAGTAARQPDVGYELFTRTASLATGQQWAAAQVDWASGEWHSWAGVMARLGGRVTNIPPGAPILYALLSDGLERLPALARPIQNWLIAYQCNNYVMLAYSPGLWASSLLGMLMPLWAAVTALPIYGLAKRFISGESARYAALWWALVPAVIVFAASWSTVYPLIAVLCFWALVKGLNSNRSAFWLVLSGALYGVGVFINFALIPLPLLLGLYALADRLLVKRRGLLAAVSTGLLFGVGMILPWLLYWALSGETFFDLLDASMQFHLALDRPYLFWMGMHLWDWLLWTGVGFGVLGIIYLWKVRRHDITPLAALAGSLALTMLILILSGTARGETGRVWLFFSPFLLIVGAGALQHLNVSRFGTLTAAQAIYAIAIVASLNAMTTDLLPAPVAPQVSVSRPADAIFSDGAGDVFRLTGWDYAPTDDGFDLRLNWQGLNQTTTPYWFGATLVSPNGETVGIPAWQPGDAERYPTTCWASQAAIGDTIHITLPDAAATGDWWLSLAAYPGTRDEGQLTVTQAGQPPDTQIGLGPMTITE